MKITAGTEMYASRYDSEEDLEEAKKYFFNMGLNKTCAKIVKRDKLIIVIAKEDIFYYGEYGIGDTEFN